MALGVALGQVLAQTVVGDQAAHLVLQLRGIGGEVFERSHGHRERQVMGAFYPSAAAAGAPLHQADGGAAPGLAACG
ncbi:hypothetical protein D3C78_1659940 [compost metagenome]